jgi:hypothetical protein
MKGTQSGVSVSPCLKRFMEEIYHGSKIKRQKSSPIIDRTDFSLCTFSRIVFISIVFSLSPDDAHVLYFKSV